MGDPIRLVVDGVEIEASPGQTILEAAEAAGIYIPRLCHKKGLEPFGSCRVCTVIANGRFQSACTQPVAEGMVVENDTEKLLAIRRDIIEMLLVEGNHFCMFCEKSGNCELQALAYRFGITAPEYPYLWPEREVDASHPDVFLDRNRCILCGRCVRASRDLDGKHAFDFVGRGVSRRIAVNAEGKLAETTAAVTDRAVEACPVGALLPKRVGFQVPIGKRLYDVEPIGSEIERRGGRP
ncbi:MAG: 2Fe-2S iron-sulfur cluster binding domain-containing protein [Planctomycetaceae bacterium]|nr:2Fe-2S iron-sulfur cluster binding domain-containing protein [Planctomycetaceae bacterium]